MREKLGHFTQLCRATQYVAENGKDRGRRYIEVCNGMLSFTVCPDSCLDLSYFGHRGTNLSFLSQNGIAAEGEFSQTFCGGMLYTCGLDSLGVREGFSVHGGIHRIPAVLTEVRADERGIRIAGYMEDGLLFGRRLRLERTIETKYGSGTLTVTDRLVNEGKEKERFALMYHMNLGYPMIDAGTELICDTLSCKGRTAYAEAHIGESGLIGEPTEREEQVFFRRLSKGEVTVRNSKLGKSVLFRYDTEALPCLNEWKSMVSGTYALGIEPSTSFLDELFSYSVIGRDECKEYRIQITAADDREEEK